MSPTDDHTYSHQHIWIWQQPDWPEFRWDDKALSASLREVHQLQGRLLGKIDTVADESSAASQLDALLQNIVQSSAIEGEHLNAASVRSSLARRLGVDDAGLTPVTAQSEGLAELLLDATQDHQQPLTMERLFQWHRYLFPQPAEGEYRLVNIRVGELRGDATMQVVSGPVSRQVVHFEAPPKQAVGEGSANLDEQLNTLLDWLESSRTDSELDPILRAAQAHLWFVTLHPFDDGNGRLARAVSDYALAQAENQSVRFYAMAASIMEKRQAYYQILESTQKGDVDITPWMRWFLDTFKHTLETALARIDLVMQKARFWQVHSQDGLNTQQTKVLNRLLDAGPGGFEGHLNAKKYMGIAGVSKATATRHLADLLGKNCLKKLEGGGRSTRYDINWP
ncbi:Fic family protein [Amphritea atlantica]|uniref:Fic family protein n=1 Tax=Amphritea atlantica TaxID=355243 RepID=A0A1H9GJ66_9GAMM|nr:Fic family protein [Amphritea atlantica]SEQ49938.1 Fic family protein [Amphritea atlantica]